MECIHGKRITTINVNDYLRASAGLHLDLGTGDGRFVLAAARRQPTLLHVGVDACADGLRAASVRAPHNALFVRANVCALPAALAGQATSISINFPWGDLLTGLLAGTEAVWASLDMLAAPDCTLTLRINAAALAQAGTTLADAALKLTQLLRCSAWRVRSSAVLERNDLRALDSVWAKRTAFGRAPQALELVARRGRR